MIREAQRRDIINILDLNKAQHAKMGLTLKLDTDTCEIQARNLMLQPSSVLFVYEENFQAVGVCGGPIVPWPYDAHIPVFHEYIGHGKHLKELRAHVKEWATKAGAQAYIQNCLSSEPMERIEYLTKEGDLCRRAC